MEIINVDNNIRCELGGCKRRATHAVKFDRAGIGSRLYMCDECMNALYSAVGTATVPKSVETAKRKARAKDVNK